MELVPKVPSERVIRGVQIAATVTVIALAWSATHGAWRFGALFFAIVAMRPMIRARELALEGALDRLEGVLVLAARKVSFAALFAFVFGGPIVKVFGVAAFAFALVLAGVALVRDRARARFLARVYDGELPEFRVERDDEVQGFELLPSVLSGTITDAVIAHVAPKQDYRTSHGPRPLARVMRSLAKMDARIAKRQRAALLAPSVAFAFGAVAAFAPWSAATPAQALAKTPIAAPACSEAVPYFEERIEALPGVGRATVIVHGGQGDVVYVPKVGFKASPELDAAVLETARSIPCNDKLALALVQPHHVAFDVSAELTVDENADATAVQRDAEEQVRALFQPDAHSLDNEHFGFGATEKTFGYRVRHALRHVSGVRNVTLVVDGSDREVPLEPTDFPMLKSLSIGTVR